jgi:hypothetical protein
VCQFYLHVANARNEMIVSYNVDLVGFVRQSHLVHIGLLQKAFIHTLHDPFSFHAQYKNVRRFLKRCNPYCDVALASLLTPEQERVRSPISSAATKVSTAAAKQQYQYNNNQDHFHEKPPLIGLVFLAPYLDPPTAFGESVEPNPVRLLAIVGRLTGGV